jgi:hypothetical protein
MSKYLSIFKTGAAIFFLLCILFIPFPFHLITFQESFTDVVFGKLINIVAVHLFEIQLKDSTVFSDSTSMYILVALLLFISAVIGLLVQLSDKWKQNRNTIFHFLYLFFCYYLILMLMKYGLDKVFKSQFYLPEPNTLYTPSGMIDKDLLYWTSMGTSRAYNIFTGSLEVLAALFLFFRNTRFAGLLLATASLIQVVMINIGFDISVKLYSLFLFSLTLYLLTPYFHRLYFFLFTNKDVPSIAVKADNSSKKHFLKIFGHYFITGFILVESLYPFVTGNNFNDDAAKRPFLHGAYSVKNVIDGADTLNESSHPFKRFFIHRNGYLIFQDKKDSMQDFSLTYDTANQLLHLMDYKQQELILKYKYSPIDSLLILQYPIAGKKYLIIGKEIDWRKSPLLKKSFHWTAEGH